MIVDTSVMIEFLYYEWQLSEIWWQIAMQFLISAIWFGEELELGSKEN
jgi:hypothetical protein